jgi:outer membrane protein assembly factor BamB
MRRDAKPASPAKPGREASRFYLPRRGAGPGRDESRPYTGPCKARRGAIHRALFALALALLSFPTLAADWPQFRGPQRDGRSPEVGLLETWPAGGPKVLWRAPLGDGYSGLAIAGGKVFTLWGAEGGEWLGAFEAASGKALWRLRLDANRRDDMGSGPRSTPTVDGELVYALGASGKLVAAEAATGKERWKVDLVAAYGAGVPQWGVSVSPLVEGDRLLLDVGGRAGFSLVALEKQTGKLLWSTATDKAGYSAPLAITVDGVRQVLFFTGTAMVGVAPGDGKVLWRFPWKTDWDVNAAMPVFLPPDKVFFSSGYGVGAAVLRLAKKGTGVEATEVWRSKVMKNHFASSVLVGSHLYGFDDGTLKCIDAMTGAERWKQRGFAKGSLLYADGHLYVFSEQGELALVEATAEAYREKGRFPLFRERTWTVPSLSNGTLFVRSPGELVALKVSP